jgi:DNA replication and repair protein RecF
MLRKLEQNIDDDKLRGFTSYGPHRDDLGVIIDNHRAEVSASRGESRTVLLALKILELRLIEKSRGKKPILLLDDVFSELDGSRRKALTAYLQNYQTFITTTDADIVVQHFMGDCTIIPIQKQS